MVFACMFFAVCALMLSTLTLALLLPQRPTTATPRLTIATKPVTPHDLMVSQSVDKIFVKFKNLSRKRLDLYVVDDKDTEEKHTVDKSAAMEGRDKLRIIGSLASGDMSSMALVSNSVLVSKVAGTEEALDTFPIDASKSFYGLGLGLGLGRSSGSNIDSGHSSDSDSSEILCPDLVQEFVEEMAYITSYQERTGQPWRAHYGFFVPNLGPRSPPSIARSFWPAERPGQVHRCLSNEDYWMGDDRQQAGPTGGTPPPPPPPPPDLELECISTSPRCFVIRNFLSEFEADELVRLGQDVGNLQESTVGSAALGGNVRSASQRSSSNAWLSPSDSPVVRSIYARAADLLQVDRSDMEQATEPMQLVHYKMGQHYQSHFDWEVRSRTPACRFATLLLYLNNQASSAAGGETAFPQAAMADGSTGFKIHPGKGNAVLFYNLLEDGNGDATSLHSALPVTEGEKWAANLWVWG